jgi:hypothetical protein
VDRQRHRVEAAGPGAGPGDVRGGGRDRERRTHTPDQFAWRRGSEEQLLLNVGDAAETHSFGPVNADDRHNRAGDQVDPWCHRDWHDRLKVEIEEGAILEPAAGPERKEVDADDPFVTGAVAGTLVAEHVLGRGVHLDVGRLEDVRALHVEAVVEHRRDGS